MYTIGPGEIHTFSGFGGEIADFEALGACAGPPGPQNITRGRLGAPGCVSGGYSMFPALFDGIFMVFIGFPLVLHCFAWISTLLQYCCGRQSPEVKKPEMPIFVHFFSPASDRLGRLSSRIRGLLGGVQKASDGFFDIFPGSGRKIVLKNVKISNFQKFALLGGSLKGGIPGSSA